jgi:hypothetical protein
MTDTSRSDRAPMVLTWPTVSVITPGSGSARRKGWDKIWRVGHTGVPRGGQR